MAENNHGRPQSRMAISLKGMGAIIVVFTVVHFGYMYHHMMMNMNRNRMTSSMMSFNQPSKVLILQEQQERDLTGNKDPAAPAAAALLSSSSSSSLSSKKEEDRVAVTAVTATASSSSSHRGDPHSSSSSSSSSSPYYVKPTTSSHRHTDGIKPKVTTKHEMSIMQLIHNTRAPIIVLGMMKAGTTSVFGYFKCGLLKKEQGFLTHYDCNPNIYNRTVTQMSCGYQMKINLRHNQTAFHRMDQFVLYAELDGQVEEGMHLPQWTNLHEIHQQFPQATFILNMRDPKKWIHSIDKWKDLRQRFIDIDLGPEFPTGAGQTDPELEAFYLLQAQKVRDFVTKFPSHELVEIDIGSEETGQILQDSFGITKECWGIRNSNANGEAVWQLLPDHLVQKEAAAANKRKAPRYDRPQLINIKQE